MSKSFAPIACTAEPLESRTLFAVPAGLTETRLVTNLAQPVAMAFAPDGRLFVTEKTGRVRVIDAAGNLLGQPFVQLTVDDQGERGALGIAFDPDFASNRHLYVYYTATTPTIHNRLSRFTASSTNPNVVEAGSEQVLIDFDPLGAIFHNAGNLEFGTDGKLYVAVGENVRGAVSQSLGNLWGKILRINSNGTIPTDNPFYNDTTGINRAIYVYGLRNPFTFDIRESSGLMYINDVGNDLFEEINQARPGANYGWPDSEGPTTDPRFDTPIHTYTHEGICNAITGALFYDPPAGAPAALPAQYRGKFFFGDLCGGEDGGTNGGVINFLDPVSKAASPFGTGIQRPVDFDIAPDGSLYYLSNSRPGASGHVWRVAPVAGSGPSISAPPDDLTVARGQPATFTVAATGTAPLSYQWQRDGVDIPGATQPSYTLASAAPADSGASFRVVVTNASGSVTSAQATLTVIDGQAPTATITAPPPGTLFSGGETIFFSGTASDLEDGTLPASAFTWRVDYVTAGVERPGVPAFSGTREGQFTADVETPFTGTDVLYRIYLTVRDASGLETTTHLDVAPRTAAMILATSPAERGLRLTIDGDRARAPASVQSVVGVQRVLVAPQTQTVNGVDYTFVSWSDGNTEPTRAVTTPQGGATFTAQYASPNDGSQNPPNSPDLTATILPPRRPVTAVVGGSPGRVTVRLANGGATAINAPVTVALAMSPDDFLDPEDVVITTVPRLLRLAPGRARNVAIRFAYPDSAPDGSYLLLARADAGGAVAETDETNNVAVAPAPVTVARPFIDLSGSVQTVRTLGTPANRLATALLVRNDGNIPAGGLLSVSLRASADNVADTGDAPLVTLTRRVRLRPNGARLLNLRFLLPPGLAAGTYHLVAEIDSSGSFVESDETDNTAVSAGTFTVV